MTDSEYTRREPLVDSILWKMPYGRGLWEAIKNYPREWVIWFNSMVDMYEFTCDGDWWLYVESLLPAVGDMFLVLLEFGWDDIARGFLRPTGLRARPTFRMARRAARRLKFEIPEIGELIGRNLPGAKIIKGRNVGGFQRFLWKADSLAQQALWYWLLVDIVKDFGYQYISTVYTSRRCHFGQNCQWVHEIDGGGFGWSSGWRTLPLDVWMHPRPECVNSVGSTFWLPAGAKWIVGCGPIKNDFGLKPMWRIRIWDDLHSRELKRSAWYGPYPPHEDPAWVSVTIPYMSAYALQIQIDNPGTFGVEWLFSGMHW